MEMVPKSDRILTAFIDYVLQASLHTITMSIILMSFGIESFLDALFSGVDEDQSFWYWMYAVSSVGIAYTYFVIVPTLFGGQTLGKRVMHIKVVNKDGKNPNLFIHSARAIVLWPVYMSFIYYFAERANMPLLSFAHLLIYISVFLLIAFSAAHILKDPLGLGLHDKLFNTRVEYTQSFLKAQGKLKD